MWVQPADNNVVAAHQKPKMNKNLVGKLRNFSISYQKEQADIIANSSHKDVKKEE